MSTFLWVVFPYLCIAAFVVGLIWRWRYDQFGWTTRSSQLYESKLLRIASPMFHYGLFVVQVGISFVLLAESLAPDWHQAQGRLLNSLIGVFLALLVALLSHALQQWLERRTEALPTNKN